MAFYRAVVISIFLALPACTTPNASPSAAPHDAYVVSVRKSPFYKYGPAQGSGPDFNLVKDQRVTMLKRSFGFSEIQTSDGETGYVATEDLVPASPEEPPPILLPMPSRTRATASQRLRDLPQVNDLPLPRSSNNRAEPEPAPDLTADPF